jgi:hypothetical protein
MTRAGDRYIRLDDERAIRERLSLGKAFSDFD